MPNNIDNYFTIREFAKKAGVKESRIYKALKKGQINGVQRINHLYLIPRWEVDRFNKAEKQQKEINK